MRELALFSGAGSNRGCNSMGDAYKCKIMRQSKPLRRGKVGRMADYPMGEAHCPTCGYEWYEDDYCELNEGSEIECPKCGAQLAVSCVEQVWEWSIATKEHHDETTQQGCGKPRKSPGLHERGARQSKGALRCLNALVAI